MIVVKFKMNACPSHNIFNTIDVVNSSITEVFSNRRDFENYANKSRSFNRIVIEVEMSRRIFESLNIIVLRRAS